MTRKEYETICRVLKDRRKMNGNWASAEQVSIANAVHTDITHELCRAFGLEGTQRNTFLRQAGLPPR